MNLRYITILLLFVSGCSAPRNEEPIGVIKQNGRITALKINTSPLDDSVSVFLKNAEVPVLGSFSIERGSLIFTPVVPLTAGRSYEVRRGNAIVASITIELDESLSIPQLLGVHPSGDSLAENTLKMYFRFSEPMVEGTALKYINLLRNGTDTMKGTFLDLQPELWNEDATILTLWLDPGRIKRDLIPNKTLGAPLQAGNTYSLFVEKGWRSKSGKSTVQGFEKRFVTTRRDEVSPDPTRWVVSAPKSGGTTPLEITFNETLDYLLVLNAISVVGPDGQRLGGDLTPGRGEVSLEFVPGTTWKSGRYSIEIEPRLEDPAGNNLMRLFDQEVGKDLSIDPLGPALLGFEIH